MKTEPTDVFVEDFVPADQWATMESTRSITMSQQAQELADSVAIYLALGGQITEVPMGLTAVTEETWGQPRDIEGKPTQAKTRADRARDRTNCAKVRRALEKNPAITAHELKTVVGLSITPTMRVLEIYFKDDLAAQRIIAEYRANARKGLTKAERANLATVADLRKRAWVQGASL